MSNAHPYPACPCCQGTEFLSFPDVAIDIGAASTTLGLPSMSPRGFIVVNLVVCQRCGRTDLFTKNVANLQQRLSGASTFTAQPPPR